MAMVGTARQAGRTATLIAAGLGLCLGACMQQAPTPPGNAPTATAEPIPGDQPPPRPPQKPRPPTLAALTPVKPEAPPPPAASGETENFDKLQGLDQGATAALFGEPAERAESPPAVLWRYAGHDCALDVYFYLDLESRELRVLHYEVRNSDGSKRPQQKCYDDLVAARAAADQTGGTDRSR
jgi:hypothetical protein